MTGKYISLSEAAKRCPYSQDYLKLRARQGKLKAVKIGRNWLTTKLWIQEYINQQTTAKISPNYPVKKLFTYGLSIFLLICIIFLLLNFLKPVLEQIVPHKNIEKNTSN